MKNRLKYTFLSFLLLASIDVHAAGINRSTRYQIARNVSEMVKQTVTYCNVRIDAVTITRNTLKFYFSTGLSYYPFREDNVKEMRRIIREGLPAAYKNYAIEVYTDRHEISELIPMAYRTTAADKGAEPETSRRGKRTSSPKPRGPIPFVNTCAKPLVRPLSDAVDTPTHGLSGRHLAVWQSHGYYFDQPRNTWRWQRSFLWQTCEDLYTQSYVLPYLVPMLENAGACVLMPRERDTQRNEAIADNDAHETYRESGHGWQTGVGGFAHRRQVYRAGENPFREGTTRYVMSVNGRATAKAVWSADIPQKGDYAVYVSYATYDDSADDVTYVVHHAGGESRYAVNQKMGGGTWIYLGNFPLDAGKQEVVTLLNSSDKAGQRISADAVKIGGGYGNMTREVKASLRHDDGSYLSETSGHPRYCEAARYWLQWAGYTPEVYSPKSFGDDYKDDIMSRARWVNALMGGSERMPDSLGLNIPVDLALAFHSDSGAKEGDEIIGTLGIFCTREDGGRFYGGASRYRSRDLTDMVMTQIVGDIRRTWEPEWRRRGLWNRPYFEARIPHAPTMLLELLSHQNFADMRYGSDPRFKFLVSRAVYKGILKYISSQYGTEYEVQPLPVKSFAATFKGVDSVRLSWTPVLDSLEESAVPTGYIVYTRKDDGGFDSGRYTPRASFVTGQERGHVYSYKVTAVNRGGESFPSEILSSCRAIDEKGEVLVVNGFERVSAPLIMRNDSLAGFRYDLDGGVPDKRDISFAGLQRVYDLRQLRCPNDSLMLGACNTDYTTEIIGGNTFDYPYLHGRSVARAGYSYCSASVAAVKNGEADIERYDAVDLILGKQCLTPMGRGLRQPEFEALPRELRTALRGYAAKGGALFVSGSYLLSDLREEEGQAFVSEVLHCLPESRLETHRNKLRVTASKGNFRRGDYRFNDELCEEHYKVERVEEIRPADDKSHTVLRYVDNQGSAMVISDEGNRTAVMGFPFESITEEAERDRLMGDILNFLIKNNHKN